MDRNEAKPYQVVFTDSPMAMTWMYPKPRAITRISVFPIPIMAGKDYYIDGQNTQLISFKKCALLWGREKGSPKVLQRLSEFV